MVEALRCGLIGQGCRELISTHFRHQHQHATPNLYLPLSVPCVVFSLSMLLYLSSHCVISNTFLQMAEKTTLPNLTFEWRQRIWEEVIGHHKYLHIRLLHSLDVRSSQRSPEIHRDKAFPNTGCSIPIHVGDLKQSMPICLYRHKDSSATAFFYCRSSFSNMPSGTRRSGAADTHNDHILFDRPMLLRGFGAALTTAQNGLFTRSISRQKRRLHRRGFPWSQNRAFGNGDAVWAEKLARLRRYA